MIHNFYNWYNIDDSDIGCDKVIVSQCDVPWSWMPNHVYKSICELIADCPAIHQIRNECIVDFFNTDWSKVYDTTVQKFLKLKSNWCLERAPVVCPCWDELVWATDKDPNPWYLEDKIVGSQNWPYEIKIYPQSDSLLVAKPFWPNNIFTNFDNDKDITDCWRSNEWATLRVVGWKLTMECWDEVKHSYAQWTHWGWSCIIPINEWTDIYATNNWEKVWKYTFSWWAELYWTKDINKCSWQWLFELTQPWLYVITCNSTIHNVTEAWVQSIRWWLLVKQFGSDWAERNSYEVWDFKYDSRKYTEYVNDFAPDEMKEWFDAWCERNLELAIMSFNSSYTLAVSDASADSWVKIWFHVRVDTHLHDHRMINTTPPQSSREWLSTLNDIELELTNDQRNLWPKTQITCVRVAEYPATWIRRL